MEHKIDYDSILKSALPSGVLFENSIHSKVKKAMKEAVRIAIEKERASKWIDCNERLPSVCTTCLICDSESGTTEVVTMIRNSIQNPKWLNDSDKEFYPTHWQPIPENPTK